MNSLQLRNVLLILTLIFCSLAASAQTSASEKAQFETDFWKSAEKMDTADAYSAYLETFPSGRFAPLAKAALKKFSALAPTPRISSGPAAVPAAASTAAAATGKESRAKLNAFSTESNSGYTSLLVGDKLIGPGAITVGGFGAKKQILVPNGEWILLAATDYKTTHFVPFRMTSIALGQFDSQNLKSLVIATVNARTGAANPMEGGSTLYRIVTSTQVWPDAVKCEVENKAKLLLLKDDRLRRSGCLYMQFTSNADVSQTGTASLWKDIEANLQSLNGKLGQFNLETTQYVVDAKFNYLQMTRFDCTQPKSDGSGCVDGPVSMPRGAPLPPGVEPRTVWARAYFPLASLGFIRNLDGDDLVAGVEAQDKSIFLPD